MFLLAGCGTSAVTAEHLPGPPPVPAELLIKADPPPELPTPPVNLGDLVLYAGDVLDHDKMLVNQLNALIDAVRLQGR